MQLSKKLVMRADELIHDGDYAGALALVDRLLDGQPDASALHWYRARCQIKLGQFEQARLSLARVLEDRPNFVPALMLRVKLARDTHEFFDAEPLLRRILMLEPDRARAMYWLADALLLKEDGSEREALALLDKSIALAPDLLKARSRRADFLLGTAQEVDEASEVILDAKGQRSDKRKLEAALEDFQFILRYTRNERAAMRAANVLIRLGRKAEAAELFDQMLEKIDDSDPKRDALEGLRQQTKGNGKTGAASRTTRLKKARIKPPGSGSDHAIALRIAMQLYQVAFEPSPGLRKIETKSLPGYQRKFAERCSKALQPMGFKYLADAQAQHLTERDGQPYLVRIFIHPTLGTFLAHASKPTLAQQLRGQIHTHLEAMAVLSNDLLVGTYLPSQEEIGFDGSAYRVEMLAPNTPILDLVKRHHKRLNAVWKEFPGVHLSMAQDLTDVEEQWVRRNSAKKANRRALDYVTEEELRRLLGPRHDHLQAKVDELLHRLVTNEGVL